jgi:WD40 repeat protein
VRVGDSVVAGKARVKLSFAGWPEGQVKPSEFDLAIVPRRAVQTLAVSPRQQALWRLPEQWTVQNVAVTPDGESVIVVGRRMDKSGDAYRVALHDFASGRENQLLLEIPPSTQYYDQVARLLFSPDGRLLAVSVPRSGARRKNEQGDLVWESSARVFIIELASGKTLQRLEIEGHSVYGVAFSPDGQFLATAQLSRIDRSEEGKEAPYFPGDVRVWNVATGELRATLGAHENAGVSDVAFSPDGSVLAASCWAASPDRNNDRHVAKLWNWPEGTPKTELPDQELPYFCADGRMLLKGYNGELTLEDANSDRGKGLLTWERPRQWLSHVQMSGDGRSVFGFVQAHDGRYFNQGRLVAIDVSSAAVTKSVEIPPPPDRDRRFWGSWTSPDGRLFALSSHTEPKGHFSGAKPADWQEVSPSEIQVWDTAQLRQVATLRGHLGRINCFDFSRDGRQLVSGGIDGTIRVWDLSYLER